MSGTSEAPKGILQKLLDGIERLGNKVPHPAVLFFLLIIAIILLSQLLAWLGVSVTYRRINPQTHHVDEVTTTVNGLLAPDGIRFMFTSVVSNFINFGPVGTIMV